MNYLVKLDTKLELIPDNRSEVSDGAHGLLRAEEEEYTYRSRYPYIVAWITNHALDNMNGARYALVEVAEAKLQTQLAHPRDGEVYTVMDLYERKPRLEDVKDIKLSSLLAGAPQIPVPESKYSQRVNSRIDSTQYEYLTALGDGNVSNGLRRLLEWAIEHQPNVTPKVT